MSSPPRIRPPLPSVVLMHSGSEGMFLSLRTFYYTCTHVYIPTRSLYLGSCLISAPWTSEPMQASLQASAHKEGKLKQETKDSLSPRLRGKPRHSDFFPPAGRSSFPCSVMHHSHGLVGELCHPSKAPHCPEALPLSRTQTPSLHPQGCSWLGCRDQHRLPPGLISPWARGGEM